MVISPFPASPISHITGAEESALPNDTVPGYVWSYLRYERYLPAETIENVSGWKLENLAKCYGTLAVPTGRKQCQIAVNLYFKKYLYLCMLLVLDR